LNLVNSLEINWFRMLTHRLVGGTILVQSHHKRL
jgi:hypothetical protein